MHAPRKKHAITTATAAGVRLFRMMSKKASAHAARNAVRKCGNGVPNAEENPAPPTREMVAQTRGLFNGTRYYDYP